MITILGWLFFPQNQSKTGINNDTTIITITIIIWQSQSWANPCALIGSFSVGILQYGPSLVVLFWSKAGKFKICNQNSEKKMWILSFFIAKLPEKAKKTEFLLRFQRRMKKTNIFSARSGLIWCRKWNGHRRKPWGQRRFYQPTENFYTTLRSPSKRISVKRSVTVFHRPSFYRCKHRIHQQVHILNISW